MSPDKKVVAWLLYSTPGPGTGLKVWLELKSGLSLRLSLEGYLGRVLRIMLILGWCGA